MTELDYLVIGAQKCATTTLFELLRQHPDVDMPLEKEVPFFTNPVADAETWQAFAAKTFQREGNYLRGKVTPQYMGDLSAAGRIAAIMPRCKLIAVLRDPLERTQSHYRMARRRGTESRSFADALAPLLDREALRVAREGRAPSHQLGYESEAPYYLAWSEYGRILSEYRRHFPADQLLVIFSEDLQRDPRDVLNRVLAFLNLEPGFKPRGLGEVMHAGGAGNKVPEGLRKWLRNRTLVKSLWGLVPTQQQGRIRFLYERWNARKIRDGLPLPSPLETALRAHFASDLEALTANGLPSPPWLDRYCCSSDAGHTFTSQQTAEAC